MCLCARGKRIVQRFLVDIFPKKMACRKIICDLQILGRNGKKIVAPIATSPVRSYSNRKDLEKTTHTGQVS